MISFYPGPSRLYPSVPKYFQDAYDSGILSMNHRSREFAELYQKTATLLRRKLNIPVSYRILFTSSATENWEILAQSLTKKSSVHVFNGAFGQKWYKYAKNIHRGCRAVAFDMNKALSIAELKVPANPEMICITHNETSNGTRIENRFLKEIRKEFSNALICVDATSSMGGINLDFRTADAWFASVQKCFGLPAGMGILVCSPKLVGRSKEIGESGRYNSFNFILENSEKWQTPFTPNISNIYLLCRVLENSDNTKEIEKKLVSRYERWIEVFSATKSLSLLIKNNRIRSRTVLAIEGEKRAIDQVKNLAKSQNFLLGNGYGELKERSFRIANFPALLDKEVNGLQKFFKRNYS